MTVLTTSQAQIQTAGTLFVNIDATTIPTGSLNDITNSGTLGGFFEAKLVSGANATTGTNALVSGVNGIQLSGYCMQLVNGISGPLIPPPNGLVGPNATATIEVWALNPGVADDECMVSWGTRGITGANMVFDYGNNATFGAVTHTGAADMPWDVNTGAPLNNKWHHLVYTFDGAVQNVYVDGVLINGKSTAFNIATNAGLMLGAQWTNNAIANPPAISTLTLARVRIHDGALTASQVQSNFAAEKSTFIPAPIAPQVLTALPVHRYSFSEAPTDNASGLPFLDSIGTAHGIVQSTNILSTSPKFSGSRLVLPGFVVTTVAIGPLAPYGDLPNGLLSVNSTNNGGSGEFSIEIWFKNLGNAANSRVFDIGTMGIGGQPGVELTGVDQFPTGAVGLDYFFYSAQVGASVNQRRLAWQNRDISPAGSSTNAAALSSDMTDIGTYQTDRHMVITWKESTGQIIAYENGTQVASTIVSNAMSAINDVNVWLGRSVNSISDGGFVGEYDEVRFYTNILSLPEVVGNFQVGPDTLNTGEQAVALLVQPRSATVFPGSPVSFSTTASGSPAVSYQWRRNGTPIAGATNTVFSLASAALTNNSDAYSCVVSNFSGGAPHVLTTTNAVLTVLFSQAPPTQFLYGTRDGNRDTYNTGTTGGEVGGLFTVGDTSVVVTHLGFYDQNNDGLNVNHFVGIFNGAGTALLGSVTVPAGTGGYLTNGYRYVALNPSLVLTNNTAYILEAQVFSGSGDGWPDVYIPGSWNLYFVGTNGPTTRQARFSGVWGANPTSTSSVNGLYGAPNLATLPIGAPVVTMLDSNVTTYVGSNVTFRALVNGQSPVTVQWYKAPGSILAGQTNLSLTLSNLLQSSSGDYYLVATNPDPGSPVQGSSATLTVLANTPPIITQQPVSKTVYVNQQTTFAVTAIGQQPLSYVWSLGGTPVPGGTNRVLTVTGASAAKAGNYSVQIVNSLGMTNSDTVSLTVLNPVASSYSAAVLNANPLVYYQFNEVAEPTTVAFNLGSLGVVADGLYEGSYAAAAGPQPPTFPNFESTNQAVFMDRDGFGVSSADVRIPSLNLPTNTPAFYTLAAWINPAGPQAPFSGIIFNRGSTGANGLGIKTNAAGLDVLEYHWNNTYFAFDTGLLVPANQWTFAALVIEPAKATFYLYNGATVQTTNNPVAHTAVPFDQSTYVGWDSGVGATARRFNGLIDEPMIFGRALSAAELDSIYATSIHPTVRLNVSLSGGNVILSWPAGTLQRASDVAGPYNDALGITSPYTNAPSGAKEFYRIKVQ